MTCPWTDGTNWSIAILPFVGERALAAMYDPAKSNEAPDNRPVREAYVSVYRCPSARAGEPRVPALGPAAATAQNVAYLPGSYRAVSGRSGGYRFLDSAAVSNFPREWRGAIHVVGVYGFKTERFRDIADGSSHTLMVSESTTRSNPGYGTLWAYSHAFYSLSAMTPQARTLLLKWSPLSA